MNEDGNECNTKCAKYYTCSLIGCYEYSIEAPRIFIPIKKMSNYIPKPNTHVSGRYYHTINHCSECQNFVEIL